MVISMTCILIMMISSEVSVTFYRTLKPSWVKCVIKKKVFYCLYGPFSKVDFYTHSTIFIVGNISRYNLIMNSFVLTKFKVLNCLNDKS